MADNKFFTNTYITNSGRRNYLRIDHLEDPLFTSFTFDIDFNSSPLFYTINSNYYGYPYNDGVAKEIETSLSAMHSKMVGSDKGFDTLTLLSANFIGNKKLGFGLQQNVFTDEILYGATEYIYMVDKRNVSERQDDVKGAESAKSVSENSSKSDSSVEDVVSNSDNEWTQNQTENAENTILGCDDIMEESRAEHKRNADEMEFALMECDKKEDVDGKKMDESQLEEKVKEYNREVVRFETLKKNIIKWANAEISKFQTEIKNIYSFNECVEGIYDLHVSKDNSIASIETKLKILFLEYKEEIKLFAEECKEEYDSFVENSIAEGSTGNALIYDYQNTLKIRTKRLIDKFGGELEYFGLKEEGVDIIKGEVKVDLYKVVPLWATGDFINLLKSLMGEHSEKLSDFNTWLVRPLSYICGDDSFVDFTSDKINEIYENLYKYETAFGNIRSEVYGVRDGVPCDKSNPTDDSPYGKYLAAKEKYENDAYSQAMNTQSVARSEVSETEKPEEDAPKPTVEEKKEPVSTGGAAAIPESKTPTDTPQTVLDMLGFISGMKKMILEYPYIINGITGLDKAYENNYGIKDPYMGSGDNKITLTCWESLDLRVSSMFNRYFNAVYDRQYRRERVPINLRRFNCSVYVHDVRNFNPKSRDKSTDRIVELRDMYFSVIEFRFYDCEIVPEETGNIFNDISNEAPSEMKKTNFTFTYGNCVVNFIPAS